MFQTYVAQPFVPPSIVAQATRDKSGAALEQRAKLLVLLLSSPDVDPCLVDVRGCTFVFDTVSWAHTCAEHASHRGCCASPCTKL